MNIMLAWNRGLGFSHQDGIVSPAYCVFRIIDDSHPRFLDYLLRCDEYIDYFKIFSAGVIDSRLRLYPDAFLSLAVALPSPLEQRTIATFLDLEMAKIDALVDEQRRLIELLKEKRQAVISQAVTKGLDPKVRTRDSGIDWLGEVPVHWDVRPLKRDLAFLTSGSRGWAEHYADDGAQFIRITNLTRDGFGLDLADIQRVAVPEGAEGSRTAVQDGDLLFSITAFLGSVAVARDLNEPAYVSQHVALARLRPERLMPEWAALVTLSSMGKSYFAEQGYGGTKIQLSLSDVAGLLMTVPPFEEQVAIVNAVVSRMTECGKLIMAARAAIELLQERRAALISAAVTGKIDVRSAASEQAIAA
jgi:type I restriction enzyme S subunit